MWTSSPTPRTVVQSKRRVESRLATRQAGPGTLGGNGTNFGLHRVPAHEPMGAIGGVKDDGHERSMPP